MSKTPVVWPLVNVTETLKGAEVFVAGKPRRVLLDPLRAGLRLSQDRCLVNSNCYQPSEHSRWCISSQECYDRPAGTWSDFAWRDCETERPGGTFPAPNWSPIPAGGYSLQQPFCSGDECALREESHIEGLELVQITQADGPEELPVKLVQTAGTSPDPALLAADGILGLAYNSCRWTYSPWKLCTMMRSAKEEDCPRYLTVHLGESNPMVRLDSQSTFDAQPRELIQNKLFWSWSTEGTGPAMGSGIWTGRISNLKFGGVSVMAPTSRQWVTGISLATDCLRLPSFMLYRALRQLEGDALISVPARNYLPPMEPDMWNTTLDADTTLPVVDPAQLHGRSISFNLAGEDFTFPVADLVKEGNRLCLTPAREANSNHHLQDELTFVDTKTPLIIFGQNALRRFTIHYDMNLSRWGLRQSQPPGLSSAILAAAVCPRASRWLPSEARCVPLSCESFYGMIRPLNAAALADCQLSPIVLANVTLLLMAAATLAYVVKFMELVQIRRALNMHAEEPLRK